MKDDDLLEMLAKRLAAHTGISVQQARDIVRLVGTDWSSLVREARLLKPQR